MKILTQFLQFSGMTLFCGMLLLACNDPEATPEPEPETPGLLTVEELEDWSNHLLFDSAIKIQGKIPSAPAGGSSLKFNIKDTLHLIPGTLIPIRFLHDENTEIAGVYIQIHYFNGSTNVVIEAPHHYDVPEVAGNDSTSTIMIGIDPEDLTDGVPPAGSPFIIDIIPHGPGGEPLDKTEVPVIVEDLNDPNGSGACGIVNAEGEKWLWEWTSFIREGVKEGIEIPDVFYFPYCGYGIFGGGFGQYIKGCCTDGESDYTANCLPGNVRSLTFPTGYMVQSESLTIRDNGTYSRLTSEVIVNPDPPASDFCSDGEGVVDKYTFTQTSEGNWTMKNIASPKNYPFYVFYATVDYLTLLPTSVTPSGGFPNNGGIVHALDCYQLVVFVPDPEGKGNHVYKGYRRYQLVGEDDQEWYPFISS